MKLRKSNINSTPSISNGLLLLKLSTAIHRRRKYTARGIDFKVVKNQAPQSSPPHPVPAPGLTPSTSSQGSSQAAQLPRPLSVLCPLNALHGSISLGPVLGSRTRVTCEARPVSPEPHGRPVRVRQQVPIHLR